MKELINKQIDRMTDNERSKIEAICKIANVNDIEDLSDGFHTFGQLYYQRMMLFAVIVKQNRDRAWKSLRHEDGKLCFGGGWFIVGIDTPEGSYTYHYEDNYFSLFDCVELERGKHWDGHTEKDVTRLLSLSVDKDTNVPNNDTISRQAAIEVLSLGKEILSRVLDDMDVVGTDREKYSWGLELIESNIKDIEELPPAQPELLTDKEQRIFRSAMGREEEVCKKIDDEWKDFREPYEDSLVHVCREIRRKVRGALWT